MGFIYGFFVLFCLFLCLLLGAAWLGSGVLWWKRRNRPGIGRTLSAVAFILCSGIIGLLIAGYVSNHSPESIYARAFGGAPPSGTIVLKAESSSIFTESEGVDLAFLTDRATFDRIRPPSLQRVSGDRLEMLEIQLGSEAPGWWRPPTSTAEVWYDSSDMAPDQRVMGQHFSHQRTVMTWENNGYVQYRWEGID